MALSVEKLLSDAHMLITRLKDHDCLADSIIGSSQALYNKVEAMKQYQDDITELNEIAKHRPRSTLVLGIAQENRQIRQLQQENRELEASLEEHQSALELIMQKYREHTVKLLQSNQIERALKEKEVTEKNSMCQLMDKIDEMAGVMQKAIEVDETTASADKEDLSRLKVENKALREMLEICTTKQERIMPESLLRDEDISKLEEQLASKKSGDGEDTDSDGDSTTLKRPNRSQKEEEDESSDGDSGTLKRQDSASSSSTKSQDQPAKKEEKKDKDTVDSTKKKQPSDAKKGEAGGKDSVSGGAKESQSGSNRSGSKSPVSSSKPATDLKKANRNNSSPVKRTTPASSSATAKKDTASSSLKKSPSVEAKKDAKTKTGAKTTARK